MSLRHLLWLSLLGACGGDDVVSGRPNVLLVTLDTVRADYLSLGGEAGLARTPRFAEVAAEGAWCAHASSASAVTPVSHASILTGQYQYRHGLRVLHAGSGFRLPEDEPSAATVFRAAGYRTGAVHSALPVSGYFGFDQGFDHFDSFDGALEARGDGATGWNVNALQRRANETTARALEFVRGGDGPWFLWIHYWDPHDGALVPPAEYMARSAHAGKAQLSVDELYEVEVEYLDEQFGALVDGLRAAGAWEDTVLALTSDHGEGLADGAARHGWPFHRVLYQEQLHVPLIVRGPGVPAGGRVDALVRTVDVAPTLYDYARVDAPRTHGRTLRPLLDGRADPARVAYADQVNGYDHNSKIAEKRPHAAFLNSVIEWPWKLIWRPHMPQAAELYHLVEDPEERTNVIAQHSEVATRLLADLVEREPWVTEPFPVLEPGDAAASGALGALGYTGGDEGEAPPSGPAWRYTCMTHGKLREAGPGACPRCGKKLFPVADG